MKIVFVGVHHKPDTAALHPNTKSGEIVNAICGHFHGVTFERVNLFPVDYLPSGSEFNKMIDRFIVDSNPKAYYVLLGKIVGEALSVDLQQNSKCFYHPGYAIRRGSKFKEEYIKHIVNHIEHILVQEKINQ